VFTLFCTANLQLNSSEISLEMNCGQRCLLRGLISTALQDFTTLYKSTHAKVANINTKGKNLRATLGKLFNRKTTVDTESVVLHPKNNKRKGKGKCPLKSQVKRKV